jgi:hypothetical protein
MHDVNNVSIISFNELLSILEEEIRYNALRQHNRRQRNLRNSTCPNDAEKSTACVKESYLQAPV